MEDGILTSTAPSERTQVRRAHNRGRYDKETIHAILDAAIICHVGISIDDQPVVTPMVHWREGNRVYLHGSSANRTLTHMAGGAPVCLTVSLLDGVVLGRSGFSHSVNFRSVMLYGAAHEVTDGTEKEVRLKAFMDNLFPGRWEELRPVKAKEIKATKVIWMTIDEASAKVREGLPNDKKADLATPVWAGTLPVEAVIGRALVCPRMDDSIAEPDYIGKFGIG
jgi:uncharacterized protein